MWHVTLRSNQYSIIEMNDCLTFCTINISLNFICQEPFYFMCIVFFYVIGFLLRFLSFRYSFYN